MLKNLINKKSKAEKGFTIIEVMIVLAIAGLILVVVLLAIPQLQRNQRNENRRSVASRIVTEISSYAGNNNGQYPEARAAGSTSPAKAFGAPIEEGSFFGRYMDCSYDGSVSGATATCGTNIDDPTTQFPVGSGPGGVTNNVLYASATTQEPADEPGDLLYQTGYLCDGEVQQAAGVRNFALSMRLEGGAVFCLDNR